MSDAGVFAGLVIMTTLTVLAGIVTLWIFHGARKQKQRGNNSTTPS